MLTEFWACPGCKRRVWTLYPRQELRCFHCKQAMEPSTYTAFLADDRYANTCHAFVCVDDPGVAPLN